MGHYQKWVVSAERIENKGYFRYFCTFVDQKREKGLKRCKIPEKNRTERKDNECEEKILLRY